MINVNKWQKAKTINRYWYSFNVEIIEFVLFVSSQGRQYDVDHGENECARHLLFNQFYLELD